MPLSSCFPCLSFRQSEVISMLDYSNTPLADAFPEVWQHERTLEELHLTSTRLTTLPPQLFYCQGLRILMVNSNNLENVPNAIGSLRQLQHLDLSRNLIANVPDEIKCCKNLTHLDLSCNNLQRLPDAITCLISLQELLLNEAYLEFLPANFGRLVHLRILELRLNNLITLPKSMARLTNLQRIDIGGNEFTELPEVIGELRSLRELWVDFNQIRRVSSNIGKLRELQHFETNGNLLDALPNELSNWRNIEVLSVCTNNLEALPFSLGMLKTLVTLKCESNSLAELPDSISSLENLEELVLSHNKLLRLPTTIGMLRKLRYLFADDNRLRALPDELCSCCNLSVLSVANNQINALPQNVGHLVKLKVLNLVNNCIIALPVSMLSLVNLTSLWLSDNQSQPLVPLQYLDTNTKTQLTCFMLPQVTFKMNRMQAQQQQDHYEFVYAQHELPKLSQQQQLQQQQQSLQVAISPTRRICFAEEATILSGSNTIATAAAALPAVTQKMIYNTLPLPHANNAPYNHNSKENNTISYNEQLGPSVRLMRSPTPYPKELRQMAKYVRSTQRFPQHQNNSISGNISEATATTELNNVREARVVLNGNHCDTTPTAANVNYAYVPTQQQQQQYQHQQHQQYDRAMHYNALQAQTQYMQSIANCDAHYQQQQQQQLYTDAMQRLSPTQQSTALPTTHLNGSNEDSLYEIELLCQQHQMQQQQQLLTPRLEPPPYHIARVFTKKTPEDLTLYESMRFRNQQQKQQEQQYYSQQINAEYREHEDVINSNFKTTAINNHVITAPTPINNTSNLDYQNNISNLDEDTDDLQEQNNDTLSQLSLTSGNSVATNATNNTATNKIPQSAVNMQRVAGTTTPTGGQQLTNKKWIFGMHKNPTVKQVTLKWEDNIGFDIAELLNPVGIFVSSIVPNSSASRLLSINDKLLEIDGYDMTNICLNDAKKVLLNCGTVINIMLSRK